MPLSRLTHWLSYAIPAAGLIVLGLFASIRTLQVEYGDEVRQQISQRADDLRAHVMDIWNGRATGPALAVVGTGILIWMLRRSAASTRLMRKTRRVLFGLLVVALQWGPIASLAFDPDIRHQARLLVEQESAGGWIMLLSLTWFACFYHYQATWKGPLRLGRWVVRRRHIFGPPVRLIPVAALTILLSAGPGRVLVTDPENVTRIAVWLMGVLLGKLRHRSWSLMRPEPKLVTECRNHLYRLQTVQSSSAAVNTGAAQFLSLGTSHTTSLSTIPPNFPELVGDSASNSRQLRSWRSRGMPWYSRGLKPMGGRWRGGGRVADVGAPATRGTRRIAERSAVRIERGPRILRRRAVSRRCPDERQSPSDHAGTVRRCRAGRRGRLGR